MGTKLYLLLILYKKFGILNYTLFTRFGRKRTLQGVIYALVLLVLAQWKLGVFITQLRVNCVTLGFWPLKNKVGLKAAEEEPMLDMMQIAGILIARFR